MTREERALVTARKNQLINFVTVYVEHGRYGGYLTEAGKKLAQDERALEALAKRAVEHEAKAQAKRALEPEVEIA